MCFPQLKIGLKIRNLPEISRKFAVLLMELQLHLGSMFLELGYLSLVGLVTLSLAV